MKNLILVFIISFMTYGLANSQNTLSGYNQIDDTFFYDNDSTINMSANNFIDSLKVKLKSNPNRIISSNINNYEKAALKTKKMNSLYDKGIAHEDGKVIKEDIYLINNPEHWYNIGGILSAIIISPYIIELFSFLEFLNGDNDEEEENNNNSLNIDEDEEDDNSALYDGLKELGKKTFVPGLLIMSAGYVGNNIKIASKETIITEADLIMPKISYFFSENDIQDAINIFNKSN